MRDHFLSLQNINHNFDIDLRDNLCQDLKKTRGSFFLPPLSVSI